MSGSTEKNACDKVTNIEVVSAQKEDYEKSLKPDSGIYEITCPKKGLALILNNAFPGDNIKHRKGSEIDVKNMKELWQKMGCELYKDDAHCNQTTAQMMELITEVNTLEDYSYLVIVIMSHGGADEKGRTYFEDSEEKPVMIKKIKDLFNNNNFKAKHVPRLFILQFCRGDNFDEGVGSDSGSQDSLGNDMDSSDMAFQEGISSSGDGLTIDSAIKGRTPTKSNVFIAYATMNGDVAVRDPKHGSWFINAITNIFMKHACNEHVADLFVMVQNQMSKKTANMEWTGEKVIKGKAMPIHVSALTKKFYLFPGQP